MNDATIIGEIYPVVYAQTGLWSFDRALGFRGNVGVPLRSLFELYGYEHSGKSTLAWYLAASVRRDGRIYIADLEGTLEKDYIKSVVEHAGFSGEVEIVKYTELKKKKTVMRSHEAQLQEVIDALLDPKTQAAVVDSIGSFTPIMEAGKNLGETAWGKRAKVIADASRRILSHLRVAEDPKLIFFINHVHPIMGGGKGYDTPGGQTKKYAANIRVWLQRIDNKVPEGSGNFLAEARVQKLKVGGTHKDRRGLVYFIPGYGVSKEMTDVFDCVGVGIAKREASVQLLQFDTKKGEDVWVKMGRLSALAEKAEEPEKHKALFNHFAEALKKYEANTLQ